jgi:hypothetical protein
MPAMIGRLWLGGLGNGDVANGAWQMKKRLIALAVFVSLFCSPVHAKTFIGVLWPMFGPLPAIGLVELVAELKMMPDVEVNTYVHQAWPSLVDDLGNLPAGTHTIIIGYSLGANSTAFVANNANGVDLIIALQPSMLSWNPSITGKVGKIIEVYNPNPWMTFGGMGSKKLIGENEDIEYIENSDSHPGAQFSSQFRNLVKTEVARISTTSAPAIAQVQIPPTSESPPPESVTAQLSKQPTKDLSIPGILAYSEAGRVDPPKSPKPLKPEPTAEGPAKPKPGDLTQRPEKPKAGDKMGDMTAFLESLSNSADSGNLLAERQLTNADMADYAKRTYRPSGAAVDDKN